MGSGKLKPLVGISACFSDSGGYARHHCGMQYLRAALDAAGVVPVIIPALGDLLEASHFLKRLDGLMLTGGASNVDPAHYDGAAPPESEHLDQKRDATTLPLIREAIDTGIPLFAICRGCQELNVALGGTLFWRLHQVEGRFDHRSNKTLPPIQRYHLAHEIRLHDGGLLKSIYRGRDKIKVNSLHMQGLDLLAPPLMIDATAADGTIEAVSCPDSRGFVLGVQWHPEWLYDEESDHRLLFEKFGEACRAGQKVNHKAVN